MATRSKTSGADKTIPDQVFAVASPRSKGQVSLLETTAQITPENVGEFTSEPGLVDATVRALLQAGFEVYEIGDTTISFGGPRKRFEEVFGAELTVSAKQVSPDQEEEYFSLAGEAEASQFLAPPEALANLVEGVAIAEPPILFESALPPIAAIETGAYRYLFAPCEVGMLLNAQRIHRLGTTGRGVRVAMVDTGQYRHPFFNRYGFRVKPTVLGPGATDPSSDQVGHGTGESANVFATAPDAELIPIKMASDSTGAFNAAAAQKPHVITCSWGYSVDKPGMSLSPYLKTLEAAVVNAVAKGITVCFSAGNGHYGFPGSHPDVISVGGVHVNYPKLDFEASSYASSFKSTFYPGRRVPDVCGLVGKKTAASTAPLIMLPVQSKSQLDFANTGSTSDGWGIFSGTSAASPQVAGVVALLLQKKPGLAPKKVKEILKKSAFDVKKGKTQMGHTATSGPDLATGSGLVNAKWAWLITMGGVTAEFFAAEPQLQHQMVEEGVMPALTEDLVDELIQTLRSRV